MSDRPVNGYDDEVAAELGLTHQAVSRIERIALEKCRAKMEQMGFKGDDFYLALTVVKRRR